MLIVIIALGVTDILFALDSIPAIFGITQEPYLVFTANVFALMGLRQLYFLLGGLLKRLVYLSLGLAFILAFIGVKLVCTPCTRTSCRSSTAASTSRCPRSLAEPRRDHRDAGGHRGGQPAQDQEGGAGERLTSREYRTGGAALGEAMTTSDAGPALSVLDLVPVRSDQTSGDALAATVSLARTADELGFRRYWLAEHHNMPAVAATNPPVLIAMVAGATAGSGSGPGE